MQIRYRDHIEPGELKFKAKWGDANLNGVTLKNCVQLETYEHGVLLSLPRFFGFGELWLPRDELEVGRLVPAKWPRPESRELQTSRTKSFSTESWLGLLPRKRSPTSKAT